MIITNGVYETIVLISVTNIYFHNIIRSFLSDFFNENISERQIRAIQHDTSPILNSVPTNENSTNPANPEEMHQITQKLKSRKTPGIDEINNDALKHIGKQNGCR